MGSEWMEREKVVPAKCLKGAFSATPAGLEYSLTRLRRADHCTATDVDVHDSVILLHFDPGLADHAAPAFFLIVKISAERVRRLRDRDQPLVDAELVESVGLNG